MLKENFNEILYPDVENERKKLFYFELVYSRFYGWFCFVSRWELPVEKI